MRVIRGQHNVDALARPSVVTIGNFDGVHRGHLALIACAREHAQRLQLPLTVLTFEPTPREFFAPEQAPARVNVLRSKLADLAEAGVDQVVLQRFDARFAAYGADAFVEALLCRDLGARAVIVGDDFRYGQGRAGDFHRLQAVGAAVGMVFQIVDDIIDIFSTPEDSGKTPGTDLREGVFTLPVLYALQEDTPVGAELRELLTGPLVDDTSVDRALQLLARSNGRQKALADVHQYLAEAEEKLDQLPDNPTTRALRQLARVTVARVG